MDNTIEFCVFELVFVSYFNLNRKVWTNFAQEEFFWSKTEKVDFLDQIYPKKIFPVKKTTSGYFLCSKR